MVLNKEITKEKKYELVNTYSASNSLMLSGLLSGLVIFLIFFALIALLNRYFRQDFGNLGIILWIILFIIFSTSGIIAARLKKMEYTSKIKLPYVYLYCVFLIMVMIVLFLMNSYFNNKLQFLVDNLKFDYMDYKFYFTVVISGTFVSLVLANPIKQTWEIFYNLFLDIFNEVDYRGLHNEQYFYLRLREVSYNAKRYGLNFSVLLFRISKFNELKSKHSKRLIFKIENDIINMLEKSTRETDIIGFLSEGEFYGLVLYSNIENTKLIAGRITQSIITRIKEKYDNIDIDISNSIWSYSGQSDKTRDMESLIKEIIKPAVIKENISNKK